MRTAVLLTVGVLSLGALVACGGGSTTTGAPQASAITSAGGATTVAADEKEFSIGLDKTSMPAGNVNFSIKNSGTVVHEFVVIDTDLAADQLPQTGDEVDEDADTLTPVDEVEDIAVGATESLSVDLPAGHYVVICNVSGHYAAGMHTEFTVQ